MKDSQGILSRYVKVLEALAPASEGLSLTQVMNVTELPRGTVHRLINALLNVGYLATFGNRKVYVLGPRLLRLLFLGVAPTSVSLVAHPILEDLVTQFGETTFLAQLTGKTVESVVMETPDYEGQTHVQPGRGMPINAAASAKAIFAFQDKALVDEVLSAPLVKYTKNTRVSEDAVRADLAQVERQGYAVCADELDPGVLSYACPVHIEGVGIIYSVGVVGLSERLKEHSPKAIISALQEKARAFSQNLQNRLHGPILGEISELAKEWPRK